MRKKKYFFFQVFNSINFAMGIIENAPNSVIPYKDNHTANYHASKLN